MLQSSGSGEFRFRPGLLRVGQQKIWILWEGFCCGWRVRNTYNSGVLFLLIAHLQAMGYMLFSETEWPPLLDPNLSAWFQHESKCAAFLGDTPDCRTAQLVYISCPRHWLINLVQVHLPACPSSRSVAVALDHQWVWEPLKSVDICRSTSSITDMEF